MTDHPHDHLHERVAAESTELDCQQALDTLYSFLDGALDDGRRSTIQDHLDSCGHCLETYAFESELRSVIAQRAVEAVPDGLKDRIASRLQELDDQPR